MRKRLTERNQELFKQSKRHVEMVIQLKKESEEYGTLEVEIEKVQGQLASLININNITFTVFVFVVAFSKTLHDWQNILLGVSGVILLLSTTIAISWNFKGFIFSSHGLDEEQFLQQSYVLLAKLKRKFRLASRLKMFYMSLFFVYGVLYLAIG